MTFDKDSAAALLRKRKPTGEEVGRAMVANLLYLVENKELLFNQEQCNKLVSKIADNTPAYKNYISLSRWIGTAINANNSHKNTMEQIILRLTMLLAQEIQQQDLFRYAAEMPVIMTQKQYNNMRNGNDYGITNVLTKKRAADNGVAVLQRANKEELDDETYSDPLSKIRFTNFGLSFYTDENESKEAFLHELDNLCRRITKELYYFNGYMMTLDIIADTFDISTKGLYKDLPSIADEIEELRNNFESLYSLIKDNKNEYDTYREQKLYVLKEKFCKIGQDVPTPSEAKIDEVKNDIKSFVAFSSNFDVPTQLLCILD